MFSPTLGWNWMPVSTFPLTGRSLSGMVGPFDTRAEAEADAARVCGADTVLLVEQKLVLSAELVRVALPPAPTPAGPLAAAGLEPTDYLTARQAAGVMSCSRSTYRTRMDLGQLPKPVPTPIGPRYLRREIEAAKAEEVAAAIAARDKSARRGKSKRAG